MRRVVILIVLLAAGAGAWLYYSPGSAAWLRQRAGFLEAAARGGGRAADAKPAQHAGRAAGQRAVSVVTAVAKTTTFPVRRYAIGFLQSPAVVNVSARISSQVTGVHIKDGQMVKAGDVLFSLDDRSLKAGVAKDEAALAKDQALLANAEVDLKRAKDLMTKQAGTKQAYDQAAANEKAARATVAADQAMLDSDEVQLGYATIAAPISGKLGAVKVTLGNLVSGGGNSNATTLVTITQMNPLEVSFDLPEADLPLIKKALGARTPDNVRLFRDDNKQPLATGTLDFVDSTVDTASGTVEVKASVPNATLTLWPGQYVDVALDAGALPNAISIPTVAVQPSQQGSFVYVVKPDNTVRAQPVTVALTEGEDSAISKGLQSGEKVVVEGQSRLKNGTPVRESSGKKTAASAAPEKLASDAGDGKRQ